MSTVAAGTLSGLLGTPAMAQVVPPAPPCVANGVVITCSGNLATGINLSNGGGPYTTLNVNNLTTDIAPAAGVTGILFTSNGPVTINADTGAYSIVTTDADGIFASSNGGAVAITFAGRVSTTGGSSVGIQASGQNSLVTITTSGTIGTTGNNAFGIAAGSVYGDISVTSTSNITTAGTFAAGINAGSIGQFNTLQGAITISSGGNVTTTGNSAIGINAASVYGPLSVTSTGNVTASGANSIGINAQTNGAVTILSTGNVTTGVNGGSAIKALSQGGEVSVTSSGNILTSGADAHGIEAESNGSPATVISTGNISAGGANAHGISVVSGGTISVAINGGTVSGGTGTGVGVKIHGSATNTLTNRGSVVSVTGVAIEALNGDNNIVNAGLISGGGGTAISLGAGTDTLTLLTGSRIVGDVDFGAGTDTLDFAGFVGNTALDVTSLQTVVAGTRSYFDTRDMAGDGRIAIVDFSGLDNQVVGQNHIDLVNALVASIAKRRNGSALADEPIPFAANKPESAALGAVDTAVLTELDTMEYTGVEVWGGLLGGGSSRTVPVDQASLFGGIVAGTHARFGEASDFGGLAGYIVTNTSTADGQQKLATQTGVVGLYSNLSPDGLAGVDLALIGGVSGHTSERQLTANNQVETATGLFNSYFIAPSAGLTVPVLSGDGGAVLLKASAAYVGGLTTAYTETGSSMNLAVGSQTISVFDVRSGLEGRLGNAASGELVVRAGVFAQVNGGTATVPVTMLGQTINLATPGTSSWGVEGGVGLDAALTEALRLTISADGSYRLDGLTAIAVESGLAGTF